jgi:hypothetical protein
MSLFANSRASTVALLRVPRARPRGLPDVPFWNAVRGRRATSLLFAEVAMAIVYGLDTSEQPPYGSDGHLYSSAKMRSFASHLPVSFGCCTGPPLLGPQAPVLGLIARRAGGR